MEDPRHDKARLNLWLEERKRLFAIENGQIEGLYALRRDVTEQLITEGLENVNASHSFIVNEEVDDLRGLLLDQAERDNCYLWNSSPSSEESVTWSGDCPGGKASGMGTVAWTYRNRENEWTTSSGEGPFVDGKRHGHWVLRYADGRCSNLEYSRGDFVSASDC